MGSTTLEVILGAVIAIIITIVVEILHKPKLSLRIIDPLDVDYDKHPAEKARFLRLELSNKPLPKLFRWMQRNAAFQCHGTIEFFHLDGQSVYGKSMPIRWSSTPEPVSIPIVIENKVIQFIDPSKLNMSSRIDIYPAETELLDVTAKFDDEADCYGWTNENYFSEPAWRNPNWKLQSGRYNVRVKIFTAGEKHFKDFRLINDVSRNFFRLEEIDN